MQARTDLSPTATFASLAIMASVGIQSASPWAAPTAGFQAVRFPIQ